jgi:arylsulfatase A-like enzyme
MPSPCRTALTLALAFASLPGCAKPVQPAGSGRGLLLIVIDGLRADHVGCYGYDRATTPELDALTRDGVVFDNAFSAAPWMVPAYASLLTGCDPLVSRRVLPPDIPPALATMWHVPDGAPHTAAEMLRNGWNTAAFLDHAMIAPVYGFARGFQTFAAFAPERVKTADDQGANGVTTRFETWLNGRRGDANWFAMLQISDLDRVWNESDEIWDTYFAPRPELNYVPPVGDALRIYFAIPRSHWSGGMRTLGEYEAEYDGALRRIDQRLGRLFNSLRTRGVLEHTTVIVTSSFGVGFGEAGLYLDHGTLTDVDLHVPLIIRPAAGAECARGTHASAVASTIDIAPTMLALQGVDTPNDMQGESLVDALRGRARPGRRFVFANCGYQEGMAVMDERWCFESTAPWKAEDRVLAQSWYGGGTPVDPVQREVLHDRGADKKNLGHARSAALDESIVAPMRAAATEWETRVEKVRRVLHATDWLEDHKVELPAQGANERGS